MRHRWVALNHGKQDINKEVEYMDQEPLDTSKEVDGRFVDNAVKALGKYAR